MKVYFSSPGQQSSVRTGYVLELLCVVSLLYVKSNSFFLTRRSSMYDSPVLSSIPLLVMLFFHFIFRTDWRCRVMKAWNFRSWRLSRICLSLSQLLYRSYLPPFIVRLVVVKSLCRNLPNEALICVILFCITASILFSFETMLPSKVNSGTE